LGDGPRSLIEYLTVYGDNVVNAGVSECTYVRDEAAQCLRRKADLFETQVRIADSGRGNGDRSACATCQHEPEGPLALPGQLPLDCSRPAGLPGRAQPDLALPAPWFPPPPLFTPLFTLSLPFLRL
jgi:hypothetical protein